MIIEKFISEVMLFIEKITPLIIVDLQENRFANQGAFNDNQRWDNNNLQVIKDKGRNQPLVDQGNLKKELTDPKNWDLRIKKNNTTMTLTIPDFETFTDSKYDKLQTGGPVNPYISPRGNYINIHSVPARNFKGLSNQDINWIKDQLIKAINKEYS